MPPCDNRGSHESSRFCFPEIHGARSAGSDGPLGAERARAITPSRTCARASSSTSVIADGVTREQARKDVETIAHEVLANPVIEEYRVEILD